jgi:hypothetical protein
VQKAKEPKCGGETATGASAENRDSDATSSETLSDLEEKEKVSDTTDTNRPSSTPSPDGAFDEQRGGGDDAGLM